MSFLLAVTVVVHGVHIGAARSWHQVINRGSSFIIGGILFDIERYVRRENIAILTLHFKSISLSLDIMGVNVPNKTNFAFEQSRKYCTQRLKLSPKTKLNANPRIMNISDTPQFQACLTNAVFILKTIFAENGHEIKIVGGAVRDLLMGKKPDDLDFATTATPEEMKEIFSKNGIRMINNNGEKHGTITARIEEKNFEVTTLRVDMVTDGRHAEVKFTKNWYEDANRRDLTVNAMFVDFDGCLVDYFNGFEDLNNRIVRFVGDPRQRIKEDYLRILRYFRFYGKIARDPENHIEGTIAAIKENANGLENISGERIWIELSKIVTGKFVYEILAKIIESNVAKYIGFPEKANLIELKSVTEKIEKNQVALKAITVLSAIFETEEELNHFYMRIKPSNFDRNLGCFLLANRHKLKCENPLRFLQKILVMDQNTQNIRLYIYELLKYKGQMELLKEIEDWEIPKFPINGIMLRNKGVTGKRTGQVLEQLKEIWCNEGFKIESEKLLEHVPDIVSNLPLVIHKMKKK